jgi:hypothetical protein
MKGKVSPPSPQKECVNLPHLSHISVVPDLQPTHSPKSLPIGMQARAKPAKPCGPTMAGMYGLVRGGSGGGDALPYKEPRSRPLGSEETVASEATKLEPSRQCSKRNIECSTIKCCSAAMHAD